MLAWSSHKLDLSPFSRGHLPANWVLMAPKNSRFRHALQAPASRSGGPKCN